MKTKRKFGSFGILPRWENTDTTFIANFTQMSYILIGKQNRHATHQLIFRTELVKYYGPLDAIG